MSKSKKAGTDPYTLVTFLLDETGSMESIKDDTIGGFNSYLGSLKAEAAPIDFTLIKFDSRRIEKVCVAVPVSQVAELTMESYQPGASTPLIDAAYTPPAPNRAVCASARALRQDRRRLRGNHPRRRRHFGRRTAPLFCTASCVLRCGQQRLL